MSRVSAYVKLARQYKSAHLRIDFADLLNIFLGSAIMVYMAASATLYLITMTLSPPKGQDVPTTIVNMARELSNTKGVEFEYRFKITGQPTVIVVVKVFKTAALERIISNVRRLGKWDIKCKLVITFEEFARERGVAEELTRPQGRILQRKGLFLLDVTVDYFGNTTEEYLAVRKQASEAGLPGIRRGEPLLQAYKYPAERRESIFINSNSTVSLDLLGTFGFTVVRALGSNVHIDSYALQFLEDYIAGVTSDSGY